MVRHKEGFKAVELDAYCIVLLNSLEYECRNSSVQYTDKFGLGSYSVVCEMLGTEKAVKMRSFHHVNWDSCH